MSGEEPSIFTDPYTISKTSKEQDLHRTSSWIPENEHSFLISLRPNRGTMQITINLLLKGLLDECRKRGITSFEQRDAFERLVIERSALSVTSANAGVKAVK